MGFKKAPKHALEFVPFFDNQSDLQNRRKEIYLKQYLKHLHKLYYKKNKYNSKNLDTKAQFN